MRWLTDILKDGTLKDNQIYNARNEVLFNKRLGNPVQLKKREGNEWKHEHNDLSALWQFLNEEINVLNDNLRGNDGKKKLCYINASNYEHNSDDPFARISGTNAMNFYLETGNIIGFIKKGHYALNISSRFGDNFLKYIISDTDGFLEIEDFGGKENKQSYEWLVLYLWKIKLKKAFRLGLPKTYITKSQFSNKVKGAIDVKDYFVNPNSGKYKCTYREHGFNIPASQLITAIFKKHKTKQLLQDLLMVRNAFETATEGGRLSRSELLNTAYFANPFYQSYNEIIDLSKLILRNELLDFGETSNLNGYLFDVSMLFEYFIRKLLRDGGIELEDKYSETLKIPTGSIQEYKRKLQPDIVFEFDNKTYLFDVKYKSYDFLYGVKREDLFQLHTYVGQYGNKSKLQACGFIFPLSEKRWNENIHIKNGIISDKIQIFGSEITFLICFIQIPEEERINDGKTFRECFKENCDSFTAKFIKTIRQ